MITALSAASSGMEAQMAQIDNISNNLANVNTTGYKRTRAEFKICSTRRFKSLANTSATTQAPLGIQRGMGIKISGTQRNFESGQVMTTDRELDMAVRGDGFFVVQLPNGQIGYKRDGAFFKNSTGRVETVEGYSIQPEIVIPPNAKKIEIAEDGIVSVAIGDADRVQIGQVQLATFVNNGGLKAVGKNIFVETEASGRPNVGIPGQELRALSCMDGLRVPTSMW